MATNNCFIPGTRREYFASHDGRIFSLKYRNKSGTNELKQWLRPDGYMQVQLRIDGRPANKLVHQLVAIVFLPPKSDGQEVNHIDGVKHHNNVNNLEWVTRSQNINHAISSGLKIPQRGEMHGRAILTAEAVAEIRATKKEYGAFTALAKKFGVSAGAIGRVWRNESWT